MLSILERLARGLLGLLAPRRFMYHNGRLAARCERSAESRREFEARQVMLEQELAWGLQIVAAAAEISRGVQRRDFSGFSKDDRTPVTVADLAVQAVVSAGLAERFPHDPLMAEESSQELRTAAWAPQLAEATACALAVRPDATAARVLEWIERGQQPLDPQRRYWVLDPVDGTKGFIRREQYAIALALVERGQILLGVLGCPNLPVSLAANGAAAPNLAAGQICAAVKGQGAFWVPCDSRQLDRRTPLRVAAEVEPRDAQWVERVETTDRNKDRTGDIVRRAGLVSEPHRLDSQAKYAVVARGEAQLYLRHSIDKKYRECVWDHAAGALVVEEAGGRVTDLRGRPLDITQGRRLQANRGLVATNGRIHDLVLAAIRDVLGDELADDAV